MYRCCVRRAFLCGTDSYSGRDYSHRKAWILDRLRHLAGLFGIEVCGYAILRITPGVRFGVLGTTRCPGPVEGPMGSRDVCERQQRVLDLIEDRPGPEREGRSLALLMIGPELDRAVVAARGECVAIGGEGQAVDLCGVT